MDTLTDLKPSATLITLTRKSLGLTQKQCAELIRSSRSAWEKYEQGQRQIPAGLWELFLIKTDKSYVFGDLGK